MLWKPRDMEVPPQKPFASVFRFVSCWLFIVRNQASLFMSCVQRHSLWYRHLSTLFFCHFHYLFCENVDTWSWTETTQYFNQTRRKSSAIARTCGWASSKTWGEVVSWGSCKSEWFQLYCKHAYKQWALVLVEFSEKNRLKWIIYLITLVIGVWKWNEATAEIKMVVLFFNCVYHPISESGKSSVGTFLEEIWRNSDRVDEYP